MKTITKQEVVDFANVIYGDNYVEVHKMKGEDKSITKVENPGITPIALNRGKESNFLKAFNATESEELKPQFVDYKSAIQASEMDNSIKVS